MPGILYSKAMDLPKKPGVYLMLDSAGAVIYVGKAKALRNRVSSYFSGSHDAKTTALVSKIKDFDVIIADSEFDALVLENNLIKLHKPKYNILLKDGKGYPYIRLDKKSEYPRFSVVGERKKDGAKYFGPYKGRNISKEAIDTVSKAMKLPTCNRKFPADIGKERPCLNYHIGACRGYCLKDTRKEEYDRSIDEAVMVFEGKSRQLIAELTEKMEDAAANLRFEVAAEYRDRVKALEMLGKRQTAISSAIADMDFIGFYRGAARSCFVVLHYIEGTLLDKDYEFLDDPHDDISEAVSSVVRQYYDRRGAWPKDIYLPCEVEDIDSMAELFSSRAEKKVNIYVPSRGDKLKLVHRANDNAKEETERASTREEKIRKTLQWLEKALDLSVPPKRIESYDISNLGDTDIVASMVVYSGGKPLKRDYRKFKISGTAGQDDIGSMREVIRRRFKRYIEGDKSFDKRPDLILIDGGRTHASAAASVLAELDLEIPVFGMVKDDRHRTRALVSVDGREIGMEAVPAVFALIGSIQEETHRFAIEYQRSLRSKHYGSSLDNIPGVGEKRRNELLRSFKNIRSIKAASYEQLCEVVPKNTAREVYEFFTKEEKSSESDNGPGQGEKIEGAGGDIDQTHD